MTKEQFLNKWGWQAPPENITADLDAVIATEIEKAKDQPQPSDKVQISKHTLVEVNRAFRAVKQDRNSYIHKVFSDDGVFDAMEEIRKMFDNYFVEQPQEQPALNPIAEAYERGEKIRMKEWVEGDWIQKYDEIKCISRNRLIQSFKLFSQKINTNPHEWEIYTEPDQVTDQVQNANQFDKDRFEAMFRAAIAVGKFANFSDIILWVETSLQQLDAYYADKQGGANG